MTQDLLAGLFGDPFAVMNTIGLVAFVLVGSSKAIREEFHLLGITIVGLAMAFAGGVTRDLLVSRIPLALQSPIEISLGLLGVGLAIALSVILPSPDTHPVTLVADAIGLAAFATTGAIVASAAGVSAFGVVAVATINAVGVVPLRISCSIEPPSSSSRTSTRAVRSWAGVRTSSPGSSERLGARQPDSVRSSPSGRGSSQLPTTCTSPRYRNSG